MPPKASYRKRDPAASVLPKAPANHAVTFCLSDSGWGIENGVLPTETIGENHPDRAGGPASVRVRLRSEQNPNKQRIINNLNRNSLPNQRVFRKTVQFSATPFPD
jgi:hypothetical protein